MMLLLRRHGYGCCCRVAAVFNTSKVLVCADAPRSPTAAFGFQNIKCLLLSCIFLNSPFPHISIHGASFRTINGTEKEAARSG